MAIRTIGPTTEESDPGYLIVSENMVFHSPKLEGDIRFAAPDRLLDNFRAMVLTKYNREILKNISYSDLRS